MKKAIFLGVAAAMLMAGPALAGDAPKAYNKCKACHGMPGGGDKVGPDLATSTMSEADFVKQTIAGSTWEGRPAKMAKFESRKMPKMKMSEEDVKAIYAYVHGK